MQHHSVTGIKLVWEQENPIQEKHRQVPRRGQYVRSEDRSQCNQCVCSRQPGKLPINSQFSRWIPFAMLSARPEDTVTASQPARCTVHRASTQTVAGKMLQLLRQWHHPRKDPEAFIRILPTEYIHLYTSSIKKTWTDLPIHSIKQKEFTVAQFGDGLWNPNQKKQIIFPLLITLDIWDTNNKFHNKNQNNTAIDGEVCTDFTLYSEGWGYLFTRNVFTHHDEMIW